MRVRTLSVKEGRRVGIENFSNFFMARMRFLFDVAVGFTMCPQIATYTTRRINSF